METAGSALLELHRLSVTYSGPAVRDVSFRISRGEVIGLLGESGCGKSTTALAVMGLLPPHASVSGSISFEGRDLLLLPESLLRCIRGARMSLVFQEPALALNPIMRVGQQVAEVIRAHSDLSWADARSKARGVLAQFGLDGRMAESYPHQLSGGQQQRVLIAQALVCDPALVLADEPTSSLDSVAQAEILNMLRALKSERQLSMLIITHAPAVLSGLAERVLVMYAGQIVEAGPCEEVYAHPLHPYTAGLLACMPSEPAEREDKRLPAIPGEPWDSVRPSAGCAFATRCPRREATCEAMSPELIQAGSRHEVRCLLYVNRATAACLQSQ